MIILSEAGHHIRRDNEESKMIRMKEEEMKNKRGAGSEGGTKEEKLFRDGSHDCRHHIPD